MPIETVELTGSGAIGILPANGGAHYMAAMQALPTKVCLGAIKPRAMKSCLKLEAYLPQINVGALPQSTNWREKAMASIARGYLNDQYGDCVFASLMHRLGIWSANDSDSGGIVLATDAEVKQQYFDYTGGRDIGASISEVLDIHRSRGMIAGGKNYKIDGYVSVDWSNWDAVRAAIAIFGPICIGFDLPGGWTSSDTWDISNAGRTVGGHDVSPVDYFSVNVVNDDYALVASWARLYKFTRAAFTSRKWISECYAILSPLWYNSDLISPSGFKVDQLKLDLAKLGNGIIPSIDPPQPDIPVPANYVRITAPLGKGSYAEGKIILGSNMGPGEYALLLGGDGPPPPNPNP